MLHRKFIRALEAFVVGDAMGMPTEFMTQDFIRQNFGFIDKILDPSVSPIHSMLFKGQVTDDTEQVLYLIESYYNNGGVSIQSTVEGLNKWIKETTPLEKGYIGPSSQRALEKIEKGEKPEIAGKGGTTCGAAMRVLAPSLSVKKGDIERLKKAIWECSVPTHNTSVAMEAAAALGFAFHAAASGASFDKIIEAVSNGSRAGFEMSTEKYIGASSGKRFEYAFEIIKKIKYPEEVNSFIYNVIGTTMASNEIVPAALSIFAFAKDDVWTAIRMGASIGGDTDTIAALSGALSALYANGHNIPQKIVDEVVHVNNLDLAKYENMISKMFNW